MAKKEEKTKIVLERTYNVPLRKEFAKTARWKKSKKAVKGLKEFLAKHMKVENRDTKLVKIGKHANNLIWKHGIRNPPHHIKVIAKKDDKGIVHAEIEGAPVEKPKEDKKGKKAEKKEASDKAEKKTEEKKQEKKPEDKEKPVKAEEKKPEVKKDVKKEKKEDDTVVNGTKPNTKPAVKTPE